MLPVSEKDPEVVRRDRDFGITHYSNTNDEKHNEKKSVDNKGLFKRKHKAGGEVGAEEAEIEEALGWLSNSKCSKGNWILMV